MLSREMLSRIYGPVYNPHIQSWGRRTNGQLNQLDSTKSIGPTKKEILLNSLEAQDWNGQATYGGLEIE